MEKRVSYTSTLLPDRNIEDRKQGNDGGLASQKFWW